MVQFLLQIKYILRLIKMIGFRKIFILLILLAGPVILAHSNPQGIPEGISLAFKAGNSNELAKFFNSNIELVVLQHEDLYSKTQAERILKDFFKNYLPTKFIILHHGGKKDAKYAIAELSTDNATFRVYFLLKTKEGNLLIHQLRIEKEHELKKPE